MGESVRLTADVALANHLWAGQPVSVMNLEDLKQELGVNFDGLLGEDLLREFRSVRINYKARVIELELAHRPGLVPPTRVPQKRLISGSRPYPSSTKRAPARTCTGSRNAR